MNKKWYPLLVAVLLFASLGSVALADPFSQPGSPTNPLPFSVICTPYTAPMISSVDYSPDGSNCTYTIPQQGTYKVVGIYKGTPGNSVAVKRGFTISNSATVLTDTNYDFSGAKDGDTFFAASYSSDAFSDVLGTDTYLQSGGTMTTPDLTITPWHWGVTPPVSISSPEPGHTYSSGDSVLPLANIADLSSYSSIVYTLNGTPVDPNSPLPISTLPSGPATFVIAATNIQGTIYATSTFIINGGRSPLTITADNATMELGNPVPTLTATLSGFIAPDSAISSDVTGSASCSTTANSGSAPGTYPIVCTPGTLASPTNYSFTFFVIGTLTVVDTTKPVVVITSPANNNQYFRTDSVMPSLTITDSAPTTATYTFNGTAVNPLQPLPFNTAIGTSTFVVMATDSSGNSTTATSTFTIKGALNLKATNVSVTLGSTIPSLTGTLSGFIGSDTASSATTGTASCTTTATNTSPVGTYPITCTAGTLSSAKYVVTTFTAGTLTIGYRWDGFLQPINDTAHEISQDVSVFKGGSTVPVKFVLKKANGTTVLASTLPIWSTPQKLGAMSSAVDELVYSDPASSGTAFKVSGDQYQYNWSTKGLAPGYWYRISAILDDGSTRSVTIGLR